MKQSNTGYSIGQIVVATLLLTFPVLMIIINSSRAIKSITWNMPFGTEQTQIYNNIDLMANNSLRSEPLTFGVYDPENAYQDYENFSYEKIYLSWVDYDSSAISNKLTQIYQSGRLPIVTIEPWNANSDSGTLFQDIINGMYDESIQELTHLFNQFSGTLYISWGNEMDQDLTERYPWSGQDPDLFIQAYQYVFDAFNRSLTLQNK